MKQISTTEIESIKSIFYMLGEDSKKTIIEENAKKFVLSDEFLREFSQYITGEVFSNSKELSLELINKYPDLFMKDIWIQNKEKTLKPLLDKDFAKSLSEAEKRAALNYAGRTEFTKEFFEESKKTIKENSLRAIIINKSDFDITEVLDEDVIIDSLIESSENVFRGRLQKFWDTKRTEKFFKKAKRMNFETFISGLVQPDLGWQNRIIREANSGKFNIEKYYGTADGIVCTTISSLDDNILGDFFRLAEEYAPSILSYSALNYILSTREVGEDFCIEFVDLFKRQSLLRALGEYCKDRDYQDALLIICI